MRSTLVRCTVLVALLLLVLVATASALPQIQSDHAQANSVRWLTYVDPRFDFSIRYPSDWQVIPRDDSDPNALSGLLVLVPKATPNSIANNDPHELGPHIIVGHYLAELEDDQTLSEWTELYESLGHESDRVDIQRQPRRVFRVHGAKAVHEEGISPLTTYQFTNLARENIVWFVWTNIPSADSYAAVYERMVQSFRLSKNTPANLREVYGNGFTPMDIEQALRLSSDNRVPVLPGLIDVQEQASLVPQVTGLTSTWKSPVINASYGARTVRCGSEAHNDNSGGTYSKYAADINAGDLTSVYASKAGTVTFAGFKTNGYGNLVTIKASGGKEAYYAHLHFIFTQTGYSVPTYSFIAQSGNSTYPSNPSFPYHLHFHVRLDNSSVDLVGMDGFTAYAGKWPGTPGRYEDCGTMGRAN